MKTSFVPKLAIVSMLLLAVASAASAGDIASSDLNPLRQIAKEQLSSFVEAPLFEPSRRRTPDIAPVTPAPPEIGPKPPPALHLLGVIQGDHDMAIVRLDDEAKTTIVSSGDVIDAWEVTVLPTIGIRLSEGSRAVTFKLFDAAAGIVSASRAIASREPPAQTFSINERNIRLQKRTY